MKIAYQHNGKIVSETFQGTLTEAELQELETCFYRGAQGERFFVPNYAFLPPVGCGGEPLARVIAISPADDRHATVPAKEVLSWFRFKKDNWFLTVNEKSYTYEEADAIYQKVKHIHCIADAEGLITSMAMELVDLDEPYMPAPETKEYQEMDRLFQEEYGGCTIAQALSCAETAVDRFEQHHDWTLPDMDQLKYHIRKVMEEICQKGANEHT